MNIYINIGRIDVNKYQKLAKNKIITGEVIFTYKQIEYANERHHNIYDKYKDNLKDAIENPDYIIEDSKHENTELVIKRFSKNIVLVLKLNTDNQKNKNSIIRIWEIKDKRLERYLFTHKIIYKKE